MDIDAAKAWRIEYSLWQNQAVGCHNKQIDPQRLQRCQIFFGLEIPWLVDGDAMFKRKLLDRSGSYFAASPGRPVRLSVNRNRLVLGSQ